jgi:hypothetical protein
LVVASLRTLRPVPDREDSVCVGQHAVGTQVELPAAYQRILRHREPTVTTKTYLSVIARPAAMGLRVGGYFRAGRVWGLWYRTV